MVLQLFFSSTSKSSFREIRKLPNGKYEVKESYECICSCITVLSQLCELFSPIKNYM